MKIQISFLGSDVQLLMVLPKMMHFHCIFTNNTHTECIRYFDSALRDRLRASIRIKWANDWWKHTFSIFHENGNSFVCAAHIQKCDAHKS